MNRPEPGVGCSALKQWMRERPPDLGTTLFRVAESTGTPPHRSQGTAHPPDVHFSSRGERFVICPVDGAHPIPSSSTTGGATFPEVLNRLVH